MREKRIKHSERMDQQFDRKENEKKRERERKIKE